MILPSWYNKRSSWISENWDWQFLQYAILPLDVTASWTFNEITLISSNLMTFDTVLYALYPSLGFKMSKNKWKLEKINRRVNRKISDSLNSSVSVPRIYIEWWREVLRVSICSIFQENIVREHSQAIWQDLGVWCWFSMGHRTMSLEVKHCGCSHSQETGKWCMTWTLGLVQQNFVSFRQLSISEAGPRPLGDSALEIGRVTWTSSASLESSCGCSFVWNCVTWVGVGIWLGFLYFLYLDLHWGF